MANSAGTGAGRVWAPVCQMPGDTLERWAVRAAQIFLAAWALLYLVQGVKVSLWFDGYPDNGPFQVFDPLRRIAAGQVGGRDFMFFHGIGLPYLHYPLFALFGGKTLIASELSRQLTSFALFVLTLGAFVRITMRRAPQRWIGAALAVMFMEVLFPWGAAPGHSLVSARSAMPIFAFAALQLPIGERPKAMLAGLCVALSLVCGTEHGVALASTPLAASIFSIAPQSGHATSIVLCLSLLIPTRILCARLRFWQPPCVPAGELVLGLHN